MDWELGSGHASKASARGLPRGMDGLIFLRCGCWSWNWSCMCCWDNATGEDGRQARVGLKTELGVDGDVDVSKSASRQCSEQ